MAVTLSSTDDKGESPASGNDGCVAALIIDLARSFRILGNWNHSLPLLPEISLVAHGRQPWPIGCWNHIHLCGCYLARYCCPVLISFTLHNRLRVTGSWCSIGWASFDLASVKRSDLQDRWSLAVPLDCHTQWESESRLQTTLGSRWNIRGPSTTHRLVAA